MTGLFVLHLLLPWSCNDNIEIIIEPRHKNRYFLHLQITMVQTGLERSSFFDWTVC